MRPEDFEQLYRARAARLTRQVFAVTGSWTEAQDVVQEAFMRAWQHRTSIDAERSPEAWVRTTAMRLAVSRWRKQRNALLAWRRAGTGHVEPPGEPFDRELIAALRQLPEAQRQALAMHYMADMSVADIAEAVGAPEGTVKARLSRGRAALAQLLASTSLAEGRHV